MRLESLYITGNNNDVWTIAILKSINSLGGHAHYQQLFKKLPDFINLTDEHLKPTKWGGRPAYRHQVRSHVANLCQTGDLQWVSRGCYAVTDNEKRRIKF